MKALALFICFGLISAHASELPKTMPKACKVKLLSIVEDSLAAKASEIVNDLELDWKKNSKKKLATYSECGSSDFYYLEIDKATCEIVAYEVGDSDGECE